MTKNYELMLVLSVKNGEEEAKALLEKFTALIEENGKLGEVDEWGKRKLAYLINYEADGYYAVIEYSADATFPVELERVLGITDGVLRFLNIAK